MSRITSSTYPVVTDSQDGDLFAIVRNGQLMKVSLSALVEYAIEQMAIVTATTADLIDASSSINGEGKQEGKQVFNTNTNKPVYAAGPATTDVWVDATGATAHTPT